MRRLYKYVLFALVLLFLLPGVLVSSKAPGFLYVTVEHVSRYFEDRIAFQHVDKFTDPLVDNSVELLLIIHDKKMQLIIDGYDDPKSVVENRTILDMERKLYDDEQMWKNRMNGKPDVIIVTDRRVEVMKKYDEAFVADKFGSYYTTIRDKFLQRHVDIFRQLMMHRRASELWVERKPLPLAFHLDVPAKQTVKYAVRAKAKTSDGRIYFCEDADGDGITETFTVALTDGFNWGYKSGPNIVFILNNKSDALKKIIGNLSKEAYYGTDDEAKKIGDTIPKQQDKLLDWMETDLINYEEFYE